MLLYAAGAGLVFRIVSLELASLYPEMWRLQWNLDFSECAYDRKLFSLEDDRIVGSEIPERWTAVFLHNHYCYHSPNRFWFSGFPGADIIKSMELEIPEYLDLKWDKEMSLQPPLMHVTPDGRKVYSLDENFNPEFTLTVGDTTKAPVYRIRDLTVKVWEMRIRLSFLDEDDVLRDNEIALFIYFQKAFRRSNTRLWTKVHLAPWTDSDSIPPPIRYLMEGAYTDDEVWYALHGYPPQM